MQLMSQPRRWPVTRADRQGLVNETFPDTKHRLLRFPTRWWATYPGYGEVADCWPQGANSNYMRMRVMVMVAVKNDLALIAAAVGPFRQFGPDFGSWASRRAQTSNSLWTWAKYVNSFSWRGDPPRRSGDRRSSRSRGSLATSASRSVSRCLPR